MDYDDGIDWGAAVQIIDRVEQSHVKQKKSYTSKDVAQFG